MKNKILAVAGTAAVVGVTSLTGLGIASAQSDSNVEPNGLVQKLAQKFNLDEGEVKAVFDEERTARETERQQKLETKLTQAVTDGTITEEQKQKIIAKISEIESEREAFMESLKDATDDERKQAMEAKRTELKNWATENNIPEDYLRFLGGPGHRGGPGGRMGGERPAEQ